MEPVPPHLRPGSALGLYLRALGRGLRGLLRRTATAGTPARMAEAGAVAAASRGLARAQRACGVLALLLGVLCAGVLFGDGVAFEVAGQEVSLRTLRNPSKILLASAGAWYALRDLRSGRWRAPRALGLVGRLTPAMRAGVLLWAALVYGLVPTADRIGECLDVQAARAASGNGSTLFSNEWHLHLRPLIEHMAARAPEPGVALVVEDVNPRGHLDAFYAYPRLLRMEPSLHAWSLAEMMSRSRKKDPAFERPPARPDLESTLHWATGRGLDVVLARPGCVELPVWEEGR
ncbi:MAG TPA: hypothetical protein VMT18_11470 [Planctomycetota bacterium]|nr:hypothetical protein [Planctomycetota bacterium]